VPLRTAPNDDVAVRAVWFDAEAGALLRVIHHLAADGVSWRVLLSYLATARAVRVSTASAVRAVATSVRPRHTPS
jgi:hypothetical protein